MARIQLHFEVLTIKIKITHNQNSSYKEFHILYAKHDKDKSTSSGSDLTCPHCSSPVDETKNSIGCDKCGCWVHNTCKEIPTEALT